MKIKIGEEKIKISKNPSNRFWNPIGLFSNISEIEIEGQWYQCGFTFTTVNNEYHVKIRDIYLVNEKTSVITKFHTRGEYKDVKVGRLKSHLVRYLLKEHKLNRLIFNITFGIKSRIKTIKYFLIAFYCSLSYFIINDISNNSLMEYISNNNWIQTLIIFLTVSSFINIFHPFTIKKQIEKPDIKEISKQTIQEEKDNARIEKLASF